MALINLRNALMAGKRLPYDAEVDWIQTRTDGAVLQNERAYIDTGIALQDATGGIKTFTLEYQTEGVARWGWFYAQLGGYVWLGFCNMWYSLLYFGTNSPNYTAAIPAGTICKYDSQSGWWQDGILVHEQATVLATSGSIREEHLLFGRAVNLRGNSTPDCWTSGKIYWMKLTVDGVLVRDYIPVRITNALGNAEGALFDRISGEVFPAAGNVLFDAGPDKN